MILLFNKNRMDKTLCDEPFSLMRIKMLGFLPLPNPLPLGEGILRGALCWKRAPWRCASQLPQAQMLRHADVAPYPLPAGEGRERESHWEHERPYL